MVHRKKETEKGVLNLARKTYDLLRKHADVPNVEIKKEDVIIDDSFLGCCYGDPTEESLKAVFLLDRLEGIKLETTYTGKTMATLIHYVKENKVDGPVLFWNTYNSVDLSYAFKEMNPDKLPKKLRKFFKVRFADEGISEKALKSVEMELKSKGLL